MGHCSHHFRRFIVTALFCGGCLAVCTAQPASQRLTAAAPESSEFFGELIAMGARYAAVGSFESSTIAMYRFDDGLWTDDGVLGAAGPDEAITSIDIDGHRTVVVVDSQPDRFDIFERGSDGWKPSGSISLADRSSRFLDVDIDADRIAVLTLDSETGWVVPVYEFKGEWVEVARIQDDPNRRCESVELEGDVIAVAAPEDGRVNIYRRSNEGEWRYETAYTGSANKFACSIDLAEDALAIGSPYELNGAGAVYVLRYLNGDWVFDERVTWSESGFAGDLFGAAVAINGPTMLVGAPHGDDPRFGRVFLFTLDPWSGDWLPRETFRIEPEANDDLAEFGHAIAISRHGFIAGASWEDVGQFHDAGAGYIFNLGEYGLIDLAAPRPGVAGAVNVIGAALGTPSESVLFLMADDEGNQIVPACPGVTIDLDRPRIIASTIADAFGHATFSAFVPEIARGRQVFFQAIEPATCRISDVVPHVFQ